MRQILIASLILLAGPASARGQQSYVIVMSSDHTPVVGLGPEDIVLRDGGVRQSTLAVEPAREPLSIVIVADGLSETDRASYTKAIEEMRRGVVAANPSSQVRDLTKAAAANASPRVAETIADACRSLADEVTDRRVVVLIVRDRAGAGTAPPDSILSAVTQVRAALWVVELRNSNDRLDRTLDAALSSATKMSGALRETAATAMDVPIALGTITNLLLSQYVVSYRWPDPMLSQLNFTTRHDRGEVLVAAWQR